jgi:hypothetical protein
VPLAGAIPGSASEHAPQRLPADRWLNGPIGLCGHRHVPTNDHWDAGGLDLRRIAALAGGGQPEELFTVGQYEDIMGKLAGLSTEMGQHTQGVYTRIGQTEMQVLWHLGNFPVTPGREGETVSSMMRQLAVDLRSDTRVRLIEAKGGLWVTDLVGVIPMPTVEVVEALKAQGYFNNDTDEAGNLIPQKWSDAEFDAMIRYDELRGEPGEPYLDVEASLKQATVDQLAKLGPANLLAALQKALQPPTMPPTAPDNTEAV